MDGARDPSGISFEKITKKNIYLYVFYYNSTYFYIINIDVFFLYLFKHPNCDEGVLSTSAVHKEFIYIYIYTYTYTSIPI